MQVVSVLFAQVLICDEISATTPKNSEVEWNLFVLLTLNLGEPTL